MDNTYNNTASTVEEKKSHLVITWIALIIALVMLVYIGYHVLYKGFAYATTLVNGSENYDTDENFLALIIALAGACSLVLFPLGKSGYFTFLYAFTFLAGAILSILAIVTVISSIRIINKKTKPDSSFTNFIIIVVLMVLLFLWLLIRR